MPKLSIYLPDDLHDEVRHRMNGDQSMSMFIREALDAKLGPRPHCNGCDRDWSRGYTFCPQCGKAL